MMFFYSKLIIFKKPLSLSVLFLFLVSCSGIYDTNDSTINIVSLENCRARCGFQTLRT